MKKLLVLMLVLGMTSLASAAMTLQISVNGVQNPVDSQININPSDHLVLDIWTTADILNTGEGWGWWALTAKTADATVSGGVTLWEGDAFIYPDAVGNGVPVPAGENGPFGQIGLAVVAKIPAGGKVYDQIDFHCVWQPNDVIITLWDVTGDPTVLDRVTIHQIPEPATMLLLGLGGLFLRRRK
jgi:hypothetical protein